MSTSIPSANLIRSLINAAEKASNIARICRANDELLSLLVQEKSGDEANARFEHDFKTLADVLIQETIKHDVGHLFPELYEHIKGEESPTFTNTLGESVCIVVGKNVAETAKCLGSVLNGHNNAANVLADEVHRVVDYSADSLGTLPEMPNDFDYTNVGIWIDPIDATAEYISGQVNQTSISGVAATGLDCVTVLIGAYDLTTGQPIIGVISQPFCNKSDANLYQSKICWGICLPTLKANNCANMQPLRYSTLGIFSSSENAQLLEQARDLGYELIYSAGAGHKALKVITGEVDLYLLSKGSTFKWDTCAPQAILCSLGGNIFDFSKSMQQKCGVPLNYAECDGMESKCNKGGLIAVRDMELLETLLQKLTPKEQQ